MNCHDAQELLALHALSCLAGEDRLALQAHLLECAMCREELDSLGDASAALGELVETIEPPPSLRHELMTRVKGARQATPASLAGSSSIAPSAGASHGVRSWIPYAAAACVGLALAAMPLHFGQRPGDAQTASQEAAAQAAWQARVEAGEQQFGPPRTSLISLRGAAETPGFEVVVFYDPVAQQHHVVARGFQSDRILQRVLCQLRDRQGRTLSSGVLEIFAPGQAAGILDGPQALEATEIALIETNQSGALNADPAVLAKATIQSSDAERGKE